jgi:putative transposase
VHNESRQTYGYRRVTAQLVDGRGHAVGRHRVARLMRRAGIQGVTRRKFCRTTRRDERARPVPDLLERDFTAAGPDRRWVADITYVSTWSGFLFLAVVIDVFSRRVVGWSMSSQQRTELVTSALRMAVTRRRPIGVVVHHSDQGCQGGVMWSSQHLDQGGAVWDDREVGLRRRRDVRRSVPRDGHRGGVASIDRASGM